PRQMAATFQRQGPYWMEARRPGWRYSRTGWIDPHPRRYGPALLDWRPDRKLRDPRRFQDAPRKRPLGRLHSDSGRTARRMDARSLRIRSADRQPSRKIE